MIKYFVLLLMVFLNIMGSRQANIYLFLIIPILVNLVLMGFYFSGVGILQQIISPVSDFLTREFGLLEQLQNLYLLIILGIFIVAFNNSSSVNERLFLGLLSVLSLIVFLEEIDYGISLYEFFAGQNTGIGIRNWHNQRATSTHQNVHYLKQAIDLINFFWFVVLPLMANKINTPIIKSLIPSRFFIAAFLLTIVYSRIAHGLQDAGWGFIDGMNGSLTGNISEFREHNTYYLYLLYAWQIMSSELKLTFK